MSEEVKKQLEVLLEETSINLQRRDNIMGRILEVESKQRYLIDNKMQLQSNPNCDRLCQELEEERKRLYSYVVI